MDESSSTSADEPEDADVDADTTRGSDESTADAPDSVDDLEALRQEVEERYDFDDFGPADMARMKVDEWEAVFDPDTWITGPELLDRVERDLKYRIATREVFAVLERIEERGEERLLAYSDEGYAVVSGDGSVEGDGTVLRDVKPTVALCSMDTYEVPDPPEDFALPRPEDVEERTGELGNTLLQAVATMQLVAGGLLGFAWLLSVLGVELTVFGRTLPSENFSPVLAAIAGLAFVCIGLFLFLVVANARLSDRFRAEEYRDRLRAVGAADGERPDFLPVGDETARPSQSTPESNSRGS